MRLGIIDPSSRDLISQTRQGAMIFISGAKAFNRQFKANLVVAPCRCSRDRWRPHPPPWRFPPGACRSAGGQSWCPAGICSHRRRRPAASARYNPLQGTFLRSAIYSLEAPVFFRLFLQPRQLGALPDIRRHGNNLTVVIVFLQPRNNDGGIQTPEYASTTFLIFCSICLNPLSFRPYHEMRAYND